MSFWNDIVNWQPPRRYTCYQLKRIVSYYERKVRDTEREFRRLDKEFARQRELGIGLSWTAHMKALDAMLREIDRLQLKRQKFKDMAIRQGCARPKGECT